MEEIGEQQALFTQQDVKTHGGIYFGNTGEELRIEVLCQKQTR